MSDKAKCQLCGEPLPPGEAMFNYHGLVGPCPRPHVDAKLQELREAIERYESDSLDVPKELRDEEENFEALQRALDASKEKPNLKRWREALVEIASSMKWGEDTAIKREIKRLQEIAQDALEGKEP